MTNILDVPQNFSTTLNVGGGINNSQTTGIILTTVVGLPTDGGILCFDWSTNIDSSVVEYIEYGGISGNELTGVTRGSEGVSAKQHVNGCTVVGVLSRQHIKRIKDRLSGADTTGIAPTQINDTSGNEVVKFTGVASAVNELTVKNAATGNGAEIDASGGDTNIDILLKGKGTGKIKLYDPTTSAYKDPLLASGFWNTVAGTPTRVSDTQFTITDTGNANKYDLMLKKGAILRWDEGGTTNVGMVISSSYSNDAVTVNIVGDSLTAGFTTMKLCLNMALVETFIIPGTLVTGTDLAKTWYTPEGVVFLSADAYVKTAGTTNPTTFDINDDGTTKFTTKPSIASGGTSDIDNVADSPTTEVAAGSLVTVDIDAVSTTAPVEAYIYLFYFPTSWLYRS